MKTKKKPKHFEKVSITTKISLIISIINLIGSIMGLISKLLK
ncbi:hypothetical protein [Clostridium sp. VAP52]|nr:hypothetical protein [Clostridium sp. VAP52]